MRPSIRFDVFKRDHFTCVYCGRRSPEILLEVDHVLAQSRGGTDDLENLVTSCEECNRGKAARPLDQTAPVLNPAQRAQHLAEHEQQIAMYARWRALKHERETEELRLLRDAFRDIPGASFTQSGEGRWFWVDASVRQFIRKLGYHEILDAIEIVAGKQVSHDADDRRRAHAVWKYFCGVCWRRIKEPERFA